MTITAPAANDELPQAGSVTFSATAIDPEDGALPNGSIAWSSSIDGPLGIGASVTNALISSGTHTITCTGTDSAGNTGSASIDIVVLPNQLPQVSIQQPNDGAFFLPTDTITFQALATDAEDGVLTGNALVWLDNGAALATGATFSASLPLGDHVITLTGTDSAGTSATAQITLHVVSNLPPDCQIVQPQPNTTIVEGDSLFMFASCIDPDGLVIDNVDISWSSDLQGSLGVGASVTNALVTVGTHVVTVCAIDSVDPAVTGCASISVVVEQNVAPTAAIVNLNAGDVISACDLPLDLRCDVADANNQALTVRWLEDGVEFDQGTRAIYDPAAGGAHTITCEVTDSLGAIGTSAVLVNVESPSAIIRNPNDGDIVNIGDNVRLDGDGCSIAAGILTGAQLTWSSSRDGTLGTGNVLNTTALTVGVHTITLTVNDGASTDTAQVTITVNTPPDVAITAPADGSTVDAAGPVTFTGTATDAEDGTLVPTWSDSSLGDFATGDSASLTNLLVGKHRVSLRATDSLGVTSRATIDLFATPGGVPFDTLFAALTLNSQVNDLLFDPATGKLWAATSTGGMHDVALDLSGSTSIVAGLPSANVRGIGVHADGALFLATANGLGALCDPLTLAGCQIFRDGDLRLNTSAIRAVATLDDGRTVTATDQCIMFSDWATNTHSEFCDGDGQGDGLPADQVFDAVFDPTSGEVWLATDNGVSLMTPPPLGVDQGQTTFTDVDVPGNVRRITIAPSSDVWFATDNGAVRLDRLTDNFTRFRNNDGMPSNSVRDIAVDVVRVNGALREIAWAATDAGLGRIDAVADSVVAITVNDGLPSNDCRTILVLPDHRKVVGTNQGVFTYEGQ